MQCAKGIPVASTAGTKKREYTQTLMSTSHDGREEEQRTTSFGRPIPRLYIAGEPGSFFGHLYEGAGNLRECIASGRIAGQESAKNEPWTD